MYKNVLSNLDELYNKAERLENIINTHEIVNDFENYDKEMILDRLYKCKKNISFIRKCIKKVHWTYRFYEIHINELTYVIEFSDTIIKSVYKIED